jgi:hypothetical protein
MPHPDPSLAATSLQRYSFASGARQALAGLTSLAFLLTTMLVAATMATGCENNRTQLTEEQSEGGLGLPDTVKERKVKLDPRCGLNETIQDPKEGTPDYVIGQLLEAAAATGDEKANFQKFYSHFSPDAEESWVKSQYWPRARKFVTKYLQQDAGSGIVYKICDRRPNEKKGEVKIFIQSLDPEKSNTPITLKKDDAGVWKVIFYTP